jgi:hypothetical protein
MIELAQFSPDTPRPSTAIVGLGPIWLCSGPGAPNNFPDVAQAPVGSLWFRTNGAALSTVYSKLAGGWTALA